MIGPLITLPRHKCGRCDGCGQIANSEAGEPWTAWLDMPLGSSSAVLLGLVAPIPCPDCNGTGRTGGER